ncbi:MAG TPA: hypothetical protein VIK78_10180 [Ruminiclostridium sp.]
MQNRIHKEDLVQMYFSGLSRTYFELGVTYLVLAEQEISNVAKIKKT